MRKAYELKIPDTFSRYSVRDCQVAIAKIRFPKRSTISYYPNKHTIIGLKGDLTQFIKLLIDTEVQAAKELQIELSLPEKANIEYLNVFMKDM